MAEQFNSILFKEKQVRILIALSDKSQKWYLTNLARSASATYVHTSKFVARCEELGIISAEVHGKIKSLKLTDKGQDIANSLINIAAKLDANESKGPRQQEPQK